MNPFRGMRMCVDGLEYWNTLWRSLVAIAALGTRAPVYARQSIMNLIMNILSPSSCCYVLIYSHFKSGNPRRTNTVVTHCLLLRSTSEYWRSLGMLVQDALCVHISIDSLPSTLSFFVLSCCVFYRTVLLLHTEWIWLLQLWLSSLAPFTGLPRSAG